MELDHGRCQISHHDALLPHAGSAESTVATLNHGCFNAKDGLAAATSVGTETFGSVKLLSNVQHNVSRRIGGVSTTPRTKPSRSACDPCIPLTS